MNFPVYPTQMSAPPATGTPAQPAQSEPARTIDKSRSIASLFMMPSAPAPAPASRPTPTYTRAPGPAPAQTQYRSVMSQRPQPAVANPDQIRLSLMRQSTARRIQAVKQQLQVALAKAEEDELDMYAMLRKAFTDHAIYTKLAIMDVLFDLPTAEAHLVRLKVTPAEISSVLKHTLDVSVANALQVLLAEHVTLAEKAIKAIKNGNPDEINAAKTELFANGDQIGMSLSSLSPTILVNGTIMMRRHNQEIIDMATAIMEKKYDTVVPIFDTYLHHTLELSDAIADALEDVMAHVPA